MISLKLNGKKYTKFNNVDITLSLNTVASTFSFTGLKDVTEPLNYDRCEIFFNDDKMITGTVLNPAQTFEKKNTLKSISGYSITGVLEDVNYSPSLYPMQFNGLSLRQITKKITDYFGLRLFVFPNATRLVDIPFEKVSINAEEPIKQFLSRLAVQRGLILAHDNLGRLLLYKVEAKVAPKANLSLDNVINASFAPNAQAFHSEVTVLGQSVVKKGNTQQYTLKSPFISGVNRPLVKTIKDGQELRESANRIICAEARNYAVKLNFQGLINVRSGFYITLEAPFLKRRTKMIIERVNFKIDKANATTSLDVMLPCVYTGILPGSNPFKS